jgi:DNA-binding cell septation regulator SpoVG
MADDLIKTGFQIANELSSYNGEDKYLVLSLFRKKNIKELKDSIHHYHEEFAKTVWDAVVNQYEKDIQKLIDDWVLSFLGGKKP